jgi:hypothetical protein
MSKLSMRRCIQVYSTSITTRTAHRTKVTRKALSKVVTDISHQRASAWLPITCIRVLILRDCIKQTGFVMMEEEEMTSAQCW